jgi:hypothetical protein
MRHTYFPVFPLAADEVICTITQWKPGQARTLLEKNRKRYRSHVQRFKLISQGADTIVEYTITYQGIPAWLVPLAQWVGWRVTHRMKEKLAEIADQCEEVSRLDALRPTARQPAA